MSSKVPDKYESRSDQIVTTLREEIIEGTLKPQERIIEEEVAKRFNVSRAPVREAFRTLESMGLINILPRRGVCVADIKIEDIVAIYQVRPVLEGLAARLACRNATDKDLDDLSSFANEMQEITRKEDFSLYFKLNKEFHNKIYNLTKNKYLNQILRMLNDSTRHRYLTLVLLRRLQKSHKSHLQMLEAFRLKDENKAERIRKNRVARVGKYLIEAMSLKLVP